jgi:Tfp pilus assembly protein PilO
MFLLDRMVITPVYSKINTLDSEIKEKEKGMVNDMRLLSQKERIAKENTKYAKFLTNLKSDEEGMIDFLKEIEIWANKSSLYIVDMKPAGVREEKDQTKKYVVNLSCEGQMEQLMDFMYNVENSSGLLAIEKYQISPKSRETSVAQCSMTIYKIVIE